MSCVRGAIDFCRRGERLIFARMNQASFYHDLRLAVLGGGQLGRMLIQSAIDYNVHISVLDPSAEAPCRPYAHRFEQGSLTDYDTVYAFGKAADLITIEIENVNTEALLALQAEGKTVYPDPKTIQMIQDKRQQKQFFADHDFPTADFWLTESAEEVASHIDKLPAVQKLGRAGYDGRGVQVLREAADLSKAFDAPSLIESFVPFEKEIAVLVARNPSGEVKTFPIVEMVFHPEHNLVEYLMSPAEISESVAGEARLIAERLVGSLEYVGLMAIEMFVLPDGNVLINELAPRPHNSGHQTIKANATSQYEQHLRAILDLPLGATTQFCPAAMVNLLGAEDHRGSAQYEGMREILQMDGVYPHIYGKAETKPYRKMGHVSIVDQEVAGLKEKVQKVRNLVRVIAQ
ncbi:MAG: 5-(carboxyamino)imidazole ribonucleotide synthase [Bacteroidota bacterium]